MKNFIKFPKDFLWGSATASYQVEGGIDNNDWAKAGREGKVPPAGKACEHYSRYEKDFDIIKELGHNCHRISIEWSRIEPQKGEFDQGEIEHYRNVLTALNNRGIKPFVTLWHFTLPNWFVEDGGFLNKEAPEIFTRYCVKVVDELKDLCQNWATINEPNVYASDGFMRGNWPPFKKNIFKYDKVLKSLARAHNLTYQKIKKTNPQLEISIIKDNINFVSSWRPCFKIIRYFIDLFWNKKFFNLIKGNFDVIGLNYYFSKKFGIKTNFPKSDFGWDLDPEGIYHTLMGLKKYNKPVYITETGLSDEKDKYRADYIKGLVTWSHKAIEDGLDLRGFMYWSLIDNFEWAVGYEQHFGLLSFDAKTQERHIRPSALVYKQICIDNGLTIK